LRLPGTPDADDPQETIADDHAKVQEKLESYLGRKDARLQEIVQFGYFIPLVFLSTAQREAFLDAVGWDEVIGYDDYGQYLDGPALAERLRIALPEPLYDFKAGRIDQTLIDAVGIQGEEDTHAEDS